MSKLNLLKLVNELADKQRRAIAIRVLNDYCVIQVHDGYSYRAKSGFTLTEEIDLETEITKCLNEILEKRSKV